MAALGNTSILIKLFSQSKIDALLRNYKESKDYSKKIDLYFDEDNEEYYEDFGNLLDDDE